jgi:hypothetical protein
VVQFSIGVHAVPVELTDWLVVVDAVTDEKHLLGRSWGHERITSGHWTCTSAVQSLDAAARRAQTLNTSYELGAPCSVEIPDHVLANLQRSGLVIPN